MFNLMRNNRWLLAGYVALEFNIHPGKKAIKKLILIYEILHDSVNFGNLKQEKLYMAVKFPEIYCKFLQYNYANSRTVGVNIPPIDTKKITLAA